MKKPTPKTAEGRIWQGPPTERKRWHGRIETPDGETGWCASTPGALLNAMESWARDRALVLGLITVPFGPPSDRAKAQGGTLGAPSSQENRA